MAASFVCTARVSVARPAYTAAVKEDADASRACDLRPYTEGCTHEATNPTMDNPLTKHTLTTSYRFPVRHGMHADTSMCRTRPTANARVLCAYMGEPPDLIPSSVAILVDLAKERVRIGRESRELVKRCDRPYAELACHFGCYLLRRPWALGARLVLLGGRALVDYRLNRLQSWYTTFTRITWTYR